MQRKQSNRRIHYSSINISYHELKSKFKHNSVMYMNNNKSQLIIIGTIKGKVQCGAVSCGKMTYLDISLLVLLNKENE